MPALMNTLKNFGDCGNERYLLDSNAVSALASRRDPLASRAVEARLRGDKIGTCEPVIAELFFGLEFSSSRDANTVRLERTLTQI